MSIKCPVAGYPIEEIHWEKGGRELPEDIRQKVEVDGTLSVFPVQKSEDSGVYTCWAKNKQGMSARRSGEVKVIGKMRKFCVRITRRRSQKSKIMEKKFFKILS